MPDIDWIEGWETVGSIAAVSDRYTVTETQTAATLVEEGPFGPVALRKQGGGYIELTPSPEDGFSNSEDRIIGFRMRYQGLGGSTDFEKGQVVFLDAGVGQINLSWSFATGGESISWFIRRGALDNGPLIEQLLLDPYQNDTWIYVELRMRTHETLGEYELRVNGAVKMSDNGLDTTETANNRHDSIRLKLATGFTGPTNVLFLDDIYIRNIEGLSGDNFLGKLSTGVIVEGISLINDGDVTDWSPSSGVDNFAMIDDPLQKDDDATYNSSAPNDIRDVFTWSDISIISGQIVSIMLEAQLRIETAGLRLLRIAVRDDQDNDYNPISQGFASVSNTGTYGFYPMTLEVNPAANDDPWSLAAANASQFGLYVESGTGTAVRCTRLTCQVLGQPLDPGTVNPSPLPAQTPKHIFNDWTDSVEMETSYRTNISRSATDAGEERRALIKRPYRSMRAQLFGIKQDRISQIRGQLARSTAARQVFPIYCDASELTEDQTDGTDIIMLNTLYRRFFIGGRIVIAERDQEGQTVRFNFRRITDITPNSLQFGTVIATGYPKGSVCFPLIETEIKKRHAFTFITTEVGRADLEVLEVAEESSLPPTLSGFPSASIYAGYPIWNLPLQWESTMETSIEHEGEQFSQGRGTATHLIGARPRFTHKLFVEETDRKTFWQALEFFDSRRGRKEPFWVLAPDNAFRVKAVTVSNVTVAGVDHIENIQDFYSHVGFVLIDGSLIIRGISDVQDDAGDHRIIFDQDLDGAISVSDIDLCTSAHFTRFKKDAFREVWESINVASVSVEMLDVLEEKSVIVKEPDAEISFSDPSDIADLWAWFDANKTAHNWTGANEGDRTDQPDPGDEGDDQGGEPPDLISVVDDFRSTPSARFIVPRAFTSPRSSNYWPRFHDPTSPSTNNGLFTWSFGVVSTSPSAGFVMIDENGGDLPFWDNTDGLTIAVHMAPSSSVDTSFPYGDVDWIVRRTDIFEWQNAIVKMWSSKGVDDPDEWMSFTPMWSGTGTDPYATWIFKWEPGVNAQMWRNGTKVSTDPVSTPATIDLAAPTDLEGGPGLGDGIQGNQVLLCGALNHSTQSRANALLIYDRALTTNEINFLGQYLSNRYGTTWTKIA